MASSAPSTSAARLTLGACVVAWFGFSAVCTACGKSALTLLAPRAGSCALTLTTLQFLSSAAAGVVVCLGFRRSVPGACKEVVAVSLAYTLGFLLLNCSLGRLQASFSETVRGLEPLTSFLLVRLLGVRGGQLSRGSATALLAVLAGATLSVWAQPKFDLGGLGFGLLANCAFSSRALLVTMLQDATRRRRAEGRSVSAPDSGKHDVDPVGLFAAQHVLGLLLVAPTALVAEGTHCAVVLTHSAHAAHVAGLSALGFLMYNFLSLCVLLLIDAVSHSVRPLSCRARTPSAKALTSTARALESRFATPADAQSRSSLPPSSSKTRSRSSPPAASLSSSVARPPTPSHRRTAPRRLRPVERRSRARRRTTRRRARF